MPANVNCASWLRAGYVCHGGLCRAAIHHEGSADRGSRVCRGQTQQVGVLFETFAVTRRKRTCRGSTLREDHHEAGCRNRQEIQPFTPIHVRQSKQGQAAGHRADQRNAMRTKPKRRTC